MTTPAGDVTLESTVTTVETMLKETQQEFTDTQDAESRTYLSGKIDALDVLVSYLTE